MCKGVKALCFRVVAWVVVAYTSMLLIFAIGFIEPPREVVPALEAGVEKIESAVTASRQQ